MATCRPLLNCFFEEREGCVLYKGYPPHRGDDVQGLLELATVLPDKVEFKPIPPETGYLLDLRSLLPEILVRKKGDLGLPEKAGWKDSALQLLTGSQSEDAGEDFRSILTQVMDWVQRDVPPDERVAADSVLHRLQERLPDLYDLCLRFVVASPRYAMAQGFRDKQSVAWRDSFRSMTHIQEGTPTLVIGRPEMFLGYDGVSAGDSQRTDFRRLLDAAGYPNRFHFTGGMSWPGIRDRKTFRVHRWKEHSVDDVGFILLGRHPNGQHVIVATGYTSLGTHAAVHLLLQDHPAFRKAVEEFNKSEAPLCVDVGFRCRVEYLDPKRPFPLGQPAQNLRIELLNPDDLVGYQWGRKSYHQVKSLLEPAGPKKPARRPGSLLDDDYLKWSLQSVEDHGCEKLFRVSIEARTPYEVSHGRIILPSRPLAEVLERIEEDLKRDRKEWTKVLERSGGNMDQLEQDRFYHTFRPILLLGATGTGKQWITEWIARHWAGKTLERELADSASEPNVHAKARDKLKALIGQWLQGTQPAPEESFASFLTLSLVSCPESLVESELFGIVERAATLVGGRVGAFVMAGTGILFLDELLELPAPSQTRLLVALDTGRVRPIGARLEYCYASRVVAATNRAENEAELVRLAADREVRRDLTARFAKIYELPRLSHRPLEIIPLLMMLLREHRPQYTEVTKNPVLRISRPALEALVTHEFPENIRDLRRLAESLPDGLVRNLAECAKGAASEGKAAPLRDQSICLEHLGGLGVSARPDLGAGDEFADDGVLPKEDEFYEFSLHYREPDPKRETRPRHAPPRPAAPLGDAGSPPQGQPAADTAASSPGPAAQATAAADVSPAERELREALREASGTLLAMRTCVEGWTPADELAKQSDLGAERLSQYLNEDERFSQGLLHLNAVLSQGHASLLPRERRKSQGLARTERGLNSKVMRRLLEGWKDRTELPLYDYAERLFTTKSGQSSVVRECRIALKAWRDVVIEHVAALRKQQQTDPPAASEVSTRRRSLHRDILFSFLLGRMVELDRS